LRQHDYRAVIAVHNESSTGVVTDLAALGRMTALSVIAYLRKRTAPLRVGS